MVESQPSKLLVAGSIPVSRSILRQALAALEATDGRPSFDENAQSGGTCRAKERTTGPTCRPELRIKPAFGVKGPTCRPELRTKPAFGVKGPTCRPELRAKRAFSVGRCSSVGRARPW